MVSFFGLKLGGDKKKSHDKDKDKHKQPSRSIQHLNDQGNPRELNRLTNNFSRPGRPDTASSTHDPTQWRAPYIGGGGAASSMVDLAAPRAPGLGSSRFHSSDLNINTRFNGSSTSLVMPAPIGSPAANRPGTPTRPGTATSKKTEWDNPFHVHFGGKDSAGNTPISPTAGKNSLEQFEFGIAANHSRDTSNPAITGYPSPPPSILSGDQPFSPINPDGRPSSSRRNAPSALRNVEITGPMALPSPAASVARTSEDVWDIPVIRNVQAKRDTLTFHTPRRQSFSMEVDDVDKGKGKPMVEGLAGNFTAFDFGETVRRGSVSKNSLEAPSIDSISPTGGVGPRPFGTARTASPLRSMQSTPSLSNGSRTTRERNTSDAPSSLSALSSTQESIGRRSPIPPAQPTFAAQPQQLDLLFRPIQAEPTSPVPAPPKTTNIRTNNAPPASAYGVHPGYMSRPLDPPPRGFRPRTGSDSRRRPPPNGLRVPPPLVDRSTGGSISSLNSSSSTGNLRSPYGPPPDEGSYLRAESSPRPPPEARAQSPFTRPTPEGDFPIQKGLPRGRRPPALEGLSPEPGGLGPRKQQRHRPMYPPPKAEPSPTSDSMSKNGAEDHGYTLPNWNDFDRASPHRSAMPPPLSPFRTDSQLPQTPPADDGNRRPQFTSSPISPKPPSLPSPSFSSLQTSISSSSETLAKTFETAVDHMTVNDYNYPRNRPLISPVMGDFSRPLSPANTRMEAKRAPPRPTPITLPPSKGTERDRSRTPTVAVDQFNPGFI
ncbi:hypothetical protein BKA56DRAFT_616732 [Ilyonectria sp. MPI-CAGE-AT-0026]|nr:hypothetical protein BKA56DRAFT_616732 [Ilyonectria sp. MPI-CAGE-AT-0026]